MSLITSHKHPRIVSPAACLLNSVNERHRNKYIKVLEELCDRHRIHEKLLAIHQILMDREAVFIEEMYKWDKEIENFMKSAERRAAKKVSLQEKVEWSP